MSDLADWIGGIPLITRYWFFLTVGFTIVGKIGLVNPYYLVLLSDPFFKQFQIWRPISAMLFYPVNPMTGFHYLVNLYFLYQYSSRLETALQVCMKLVLADGSIYQFAYCVGTAFFFAVKLQPTYGDLVGFSRQETFRGLFDGRPADYLFLLLFNWICIAIASLTVGLRVLMVAGVMSVIYIWAQVNKDVTVSFLFGTQFKAFYLPWVILLFNLIVSGAFIEELIGNLVGHLYFFLMYKYPLDLGGRSFLSTPQILYRWLPNRRGGVSGFGVPPASWRRPADDPQGGGRHNWGRGFRLGDQ